jgi:hypothetical protein
MGEEIDLSLMPYDDWLALVFDHPVPEASVRWHWILVCTVSY